MNPSTSSGAKRARAAAAAVLLLASARAARGADAFAWPDLSAAPAAASADRKDAAVIVGVERYALVAGVPGALRNAEDWRAYLAEARGLGAERTALLRDAEATRESIAAAAARAAAQVEPGGTLWFVFVGQGAPATGRDGLLVGADAPREAAGLAARSLPLRELLALLDRGRQARTVVLIDASFSGILPTRLPLAPGLVPKLLNRESLGAFDPRDVVMVAARFKQPAGPLPGPGPARPAFGYLALGALRGWGAEADGTVTATGVVEFARKALSLVRGRTQTPVLLAGAGRAPLGSGREAPPDLTRLETAEAASAEAATGGGAGAARGGEAAGIEWVRIPGGSFTLGSDDGAADERPAHRVTLRTFEMAKTLVTNKQYAACVKAGACTPPARCGHGDRFDGDDQPVVCVDWAQARAFSAWVGGRLPTEAEWEYAARSAGKDRRYPWGDEEPTCARAVFTGCSRRVTSPVCSKPEGATEQGLCDMAGDAAEWIEDGYHLSYAGAPGDGSAWPGSGDLRGRRGGSWRSPAAGMRAGHRDVVGASYRIAALGFRPAR